MIAKYLDIELKDDNTSNGGISYAGETVRDFVLECNIGMNIALKELNKHLKSCGIQKIKNKSEIINRYCIIRKFKKALKIANKTEKLKRQTEGIKKSIYRIQKTRKYTIADSVWVDCFLNRWKQDYSTIGILIFGIIMIFLTSFLFLFIFSNILV